VPGVIAAATPALAIEKRPLVTVSAVAASKSGIIAIPPIATTPPAATVAKTTKAAAAPNATHRAPFAETLRTSFITIIHTPLILLLVKK
jgi:hypothetical protein